MTLKLCLWMLTLAMLLWIFEQSETYEKLYPEERADIMLAAIRENAEICPASLFCSPETDAYFIPTPCCELCTCEMCEWSPSGEKCCPTYLPNNYSAILSERRNVTRACTKTGTTTLNGTYMFASCPGDTEASLEYNCTTEQTNNNLTEHLPLTHRRSGDIYKNMYCAICNSVALEETELWQARMVCGRVNKQYPTLAEVLADDSGGNVCQILFEPMSGMLQEDDTCKVIKSRDPKCNMAGLWDRYDEALEYACKSYTSPIILPSQSPKFYANIFCALCNGVDNFSDIQCSIDKFPQNFQLDVSYSALLNPSAYATLHLTENSCPVKHNVKGVCIKPKCSLLRWFDGDKCQLIMKYITVFTFQAIFRIVPKFEIPLNNGFSAVPDLTEFIFRSLFEVYSNRTCNLQTWLGVRWMSDNKTGPMLTFLDLKVTCTVKGAHDPEIIYKTVFNKKFINFHLYGNASHSFTIYTRDPSDNMFPDTVYCNGTKYASILPEMLLFNGTLSFEINDCQMHYRLESFQNVYKIPLLMVVNRYYKAPIFNGNTLLSLTVCPVTPVARSEFNWTETVTGLLFTTANIQLYSWDYYYQDWNRSVIMVCVDIYKQLIASKGNTCWQIRITLMLVLNAIVMSMD